MKLIYIRSTMEPKNYSTVKCVLHKFPYLESSDTLKINPKSKFLFIFLYYITNFYLHHIYYTNYLYYIISIFISLFTLIIGLKHLNQTFSLFTSFKSFKPGKTVFKTFKLFKRLNIFTI